MKVGTMEIIDTIWFSNPTGQVGIILVEDMYDGLKCYIGTSDPLKKHSPACECVNCIKDRRKCESK